MSQDPLRRVTMDPRRVSIKAIGEHVMGMSVGSKNSDLALRIALFTALAQCGFGLLLLAGIQVYVILETVVRPFMWALLTGTFLFPFKLILAEYVKRWLDKVRGSTTGIVAAAALTPFFVLDAGLEYVGEEIVETGKKHGRKALIVAAVVAITFCVYTVMEPYLGLVISGLISSLGFLWGASGEITATRLMLLIVLPYGVALHIFWSTGHRRMLLYAAAPLWLMIGFYVLHVFGALAVPLYFFFGFCTAIGYRYGVKEDEEPSEVGTPYEEETEEIAELIATGPIGRRFTVHADAVRTTLKELRRGSEQEEVAEGTRYIIYVVRMFFLWEALVSYYVIPLFLLPVFYRAAKSFIRQRNLAAGLRTRLDIPEVQAVTGQVKRWARDRRAVITPSFLKDVLRHAKIGDRKVLAYFESITDEAVSALLIFLMFLFLAIGSVIAVLQVKQETTYLVEVTGAMVDEAVKNNPEYYSWLPETEELKEYSHSAYIHSRDYALKTLLSAVSESNKTRAEELEQQLAAIADQFYSRYIEKNESATLGADGDPMKGLGSLLGASPIGDPLMWLSSGENGTNPLNAIWSSDNSSKISLDGITNVFTTATKYLDITRIKMFIQEHIETFMSVFESTYTLVKDNVSILSSLVMTLVDMILTYFSAFLELIICAIVYLTTLFSLLASSGTRYRPIEIISGANAYISGAESFAAIIENTVSGIFAVSLKMGAFYGFYTWVLMSMCGVYVRFIPSVLAAIFAVCPLVPTYAVVVPAALNMWLRGEYIPLVVLLIGAYLPTMFVDEAIYGDLKTGDPSLFGIAVGGGLATMGIEGAVIGPLLLCLFFIVFETGKMVIESKFLNTT